MKSLEGCFWWPIMAAGEAPINNYRISTDWMLLRGEPLPVLRGYLAWTCPEKSGMMFWFRNVWSMRIFVLRNQGSKSSHWSLSPETGSRSYSLHFEGPRWAKASRSRLSWDRSDRRPLVKNMCVCAASTLVWWFQLNDVWVDQNSYFVLVVSLHFSRLKPSSGHIWYGFKTHSFTMISPIELMTSPN